MWCCHHAGGTEDEYDIREGVHSINEGKTSADRTKYAGQMKDAAASGSNNQNKDMKEEKTNEKLEKNNSNDGRCSDGDDDDSSSIRRGVDQWRPEKSHSDSGLCSEHKSYRYVCGTG